MAIGISSVEISAAAEPARSSTASRSDASARSGPTASLGIGAVVAGAEGTGAGPGTVGFLDVGWFVGRSTAVVLGVTGVWRPEGSESIRHSVWSLGVEHWFSRRYCGRIGLGASHLGRFEADADVGDALGIGIGLTVGVGREVWSWGHLAVNVQLLGAAGVHGGDAESKFAEFGGGGLEVAWQ